MSSNAFHGNAAAKDELLARCQSAREHRRFRQGGCTNETNMSSGCAVSIMLDAQDQHPQLMEFETRHGISYICASLIEHVFEALPEDIAVIWPERVIAAIMPGDDTTLIGWQIMYSAIKEHPGSSHRMLKPTVDKTLSSLRTLLEGGELDIIDIVEDYKAARKQEKKVYEALGKQGHPFLYLMVQCSNVLEAISSLDFHERDNIVLRAVLYVMRTAGHEGPSLVARKMLALLMETQPHLPAPTKPLQIGRVKLLERAQA